MIVDDEPDLRQLVSVMLRDHYTVLEANSGFQALKMLDQEFSSVTRRGRIVAVLSDIMMPGMDGLTLLRRIKAEFNLPVIMLTVKADSHYVMAALQGGADDFIVKPFVADLLLEKLARVAHR
jgi:CheY-like chemotaxis protein